MKAFIQLLVVLVVLIVSVALFTPAPQVAFFLYMFRDSCNNAIPNPVSNERGDIAEEWLQVCSGIGTVLNYSITLRPRGAKAPQTLVEYSPSTEANDDTTLRWIDNDMLNVDLGKVRAVWGKVSRLGSIRITYSYTYSNIE